jgi:hypothetical protein
MTPIAAGDRTTRRQAAYAVARAYIGHPLWWLALTLFAALGVWATIAAIDVTRGLGLWSPYALGTWLFALVSFTFAVAYVPGALGLSIYRARQLYYLDSGDARAALALRPAKLRDRRARPGDLHAHSFGAWPKDKHAGTRLGEAVRDQVHANGGRITGTALPAAAKRYVKRGMHDDGPVWHFLRRVVSLPPDAALNVVATTCDTDAAP